MVQNYAPGKGDGAESVPLANAAPMKAKKNKFVCKVVWLKSSIMCKFDDPRLTSSRLNKFELKKLKFVENTVVRVLKSSRKFVIARNDS